MPFELLAANAAPAFSLTPAAVVTFLLGSITILLGAVVWFLQREIKSNDEAHRQLRADVKTVEADVKQLLAGQSRIEGLLEGMVGGHAGRD